MGNTSQCTEHVDHEDDSGTDLSASPQIMVMMTMIIMVIIREAILSRKVQFF